MTTRDFWLVICILYSSVIYVLLTEAGCGEQMTCGGYSFGCLWSDANWLSRDRLASLSQISLAIQTLVQHIYIARQFLHSYVYNIYVRYKEFYERNHPVHIIYELCPQLISIWQSDTLTTNWHCLWSGILAHLVAPPGSTFFAWLHLTLVPLTPNIMRIT